MGKKRRILLASLLLTIAGGLVLVVTLRHDPEPVYQGKTFSAWLEFDTPGQWEEARAAIRQMGTNAIPPLLQRLRATDPPFMLKLVALAQKQNVITIHYRPPSSQHTAALMALQSLGPEAQGALPELLKIYDQNPSLQVQAGMPQVFGSIGPAAKAAAPSLLQNMNNSGEFRRITIVRALGAIHGEPDLVVPALVKLLKDPNFGVRMEAVSALGAFGPLAKTAIPSLIELAKEPDKSIQGNMYHDWSSSPTGSKQIATALRQIDPEAAAKTGLK
jgi:hypothetical protein